MVTIQTIFIAICLLLAGTLTGYGFLKSREASLEAGKDLLDELNVSVVQEMERLSQRPMQLVENLPNISAISQKPTGLDHPLLEYFNTALDNNDTLSGLYLGWDDGDFYYVSRVRENENYRLKMNAPEATERIIYSITEKDGKRLRTTGFYTLEGEPTGPLQTISTEYDPRKHRWYKDGKSHPGTPQRTSMHMLAAQHVFGTIFTNTFWGNPGGVVGADIMVDDLAQFLVNRTPGPDGRIVVFDDNGRAFFSSKRNGTPAPDENDAVNHFVVTDIETMKDPVLSGMHEAYVTKKPGVGQPFTFLVGEVSYIADTRRGTFSPMEVLVVVIATEDYFTEEIRKIGRNSLLFAAVIITIAILIIMIVSRKISTPLRALTRKTDEIRQFNLDVQVDVHSRIKEVARLAESISGMKSGIQTFAQYIPKDLVKRYIGSDITPEIGGDRRTLTLLFTDIAGFTTMSEGMVPETIITMLSDYFSRMGKIVASNNGTIDKYIGDALMAFWNAPERTEAHTLEACEAALQCAQAVRDYEYMDDTGNTNTFQTRFGLHRGESVVGNMGSSDRLNYTALGSTVNMASRLEGLNKYYGTTILASEAVKLHAAEYFVFKSVDKVLPKGALTPISIYELVGSRSGCSIPEVEVTLAITEHLKEWERAYALFQARRWDEALALFEEMEGANDTLVSIYIERSRQYKQEEPAQDWDGVEVMIAK